MESRYEWLVSVVIKHAYWGEGRFSGLSAVLGETGQEILRKNGLLCKPAADGFKILFDTRWSGSLRQRADLLAGRLDLLFRLELTDPDFYNYTGLTPGDLTRSFFYFSNTVAGAGKRPAAGCLHGETVVTENDLVVFNRLPGHFTGAVMGWLQLILEPGLEFHYEIRWPARSAYWRYILVSDHLRELSRPAIIDPVTREAFTGPENIILRDHRGALSFVSPDQLSFRARDRKIFQLVENYEQGSDRYKVILKALPGPDIGVISDARLLPDDPAGAGKDGVPGRAGTDVTGGIMDMSAVADVSVAGSRTGKKDYAEIFIY